MTERRLEKACLVAYAPDGATGRERQRVPMDQTFNPRSVGVMSETETNYKWT